MEQSATVWHSSLTEENSDDLERVQKSAVKIILGDGYIDYEKALIRLDMESLKDRRENPKTSKMFPENDKIHQKETRNHKKYLVQHAHTEGLRSSIIYMQNLLNING